MTAPSASGGRDSLRLWLVFGALSLAWGSSFFFIKIGVEEGLGPVTLVSYRLGIAVVALTVLLRMTGGRLPTGRDALVRLAVLGIFNVALPFTLITWAELWIPSARASIFNGLAPLFTIVIAAVALHDEPMTANRLVGLLIGFAGALLLISPNLTGGAAAADPMMSLLGDIAMTVATLSYAGAAVYIRLRISGRPLIEDPVRGARPLTPVEVALPQCLFAVGITGTLAFLLDGRGSVPLPPSLDAWFAVAWLGIIGSAFAYLFYFRIITAWGATRASMVTYVMPLVGIGLGVLFLGERLGLAELAGAALVIGGLVLANSALGQRRLYGRAAAIAERKARET